MSSWEPLADSGAPGVGNVFEEERVGEDTAAELRLGYEFILVDLDGDGAGVPLLADAFDAEDGVGLALVVEGEGEGAGRICGLP
jgi:hypothetical protein